MTRAERTRELAVRIGGSRQPVEHFGLPRDDVYEALAPNDPARPHAYRSGFVALVDLAPRSCPTRADLELVLSLAGGAETLIPVGSIDIEPAARLAPVTPRRPVFPGRSGPRVAICMATYEPPADLLRRQLDSIREQTHGELDLPDQRRRLLRGGLRASCSPRPDGDERFVVSRSPERLGFYRNFERALSMAPETADYVAFCDQDDRWYADKLERLIDGIGNAQLVYSDARIVSPADELVRPSYWTERRNNHTNFALAAAGQLRHRRGLAVPPRPARRRAAVPAPPGTGFPRPLDRRGSHGTGRARLSGRTPLRLRPARARP